MAQVASLGRIVHYVPSAQDTLTETRPAIIVRVWNEEIGNCNLQVFTDGGNDSGENVAWRTSVVFSETPTPGTWHWPPRV